MTFAPVAPTTYVPPTKIAPDTYVIHQVQPALGEPLFVYLNSMVIRGDEPMIVDTGTPANREQWLSDAFSLVEPEDVRWVFLSHDDVDHSGNLDQVMTACPNAQLVCNWAMVERHSNCFNFPLQRCRWIMHNESFSIGDRTLHAIRDHDKYGRFVDSVQQLDIKTIAACHTPVIEGPFIKRAFDRIRQFPSVEPPPLPDQSILDQIIAATALPPA